MDQAFLKSRLDYDPATGIFTWKPYKYGKIIGGTIAGTITASGYRRIGLSGIDYLASRLAWFYMTGNWPSGEIDHADRDRLNDKFSNLREATRSKNNSNAEHKRAESGYRGVRKQRNKWVARIRVNGPSMHLGTFSTPQEAARAYDVAARHNFGEFSITNFDVG